MRTEFHVFRKINKHNFLNYIIHKSRYLSKVEICVLFHLQHFHNDFMNEFTFGHVIIRGKGGQKLIKNYLGRGCVRTCGNFKNEKRKKQHGSSVNYLKIFLVEYLFTFSGIFGTFGIKKRNQVKLDRRRKRWYLLLVTLIASMKFLFMEGRLGSKIFLHTI